MLPRFMPKRLDTPAGEILVREVQRKDLGELNEIINQPGVNRFVLVEKPVSLKSTLEAYNRAKKSKKVWVACIFHGKAVGSIDLRDKAGRESHVCDFGIAFSSKVHGKGIAEVMFRFIFEWLRMNKIEKIVSETFSDNLKARNFYKKLGFIEKCALKKNVKRGKKYADSIIIEKFL